MATNTLTEPRERRTRRRNGEGTTNTYKNGYRTAIQFQGRMVTATGKSPTESRRRAKAKLKALPSNLTGLVPQAAYVTVKEFFPGWLINQHKRKIAASTFDRYLGLMNNFILPMLGHLKIQAITKQHINHLLNEMNNQGQSSRSQQQAKSLMSVAFTAAVNDDLIPANPVKKAISIHNKKYEIQPLPLADVMKILKHTDGTPMHARVRIAMLYGLRQGEALGLRWSDIHFDSKSLSVIEQIQTVDKVRTVVGLKSEKSRRTLEIDEETLVALKAHKAMQNAERLKVGNRWIDKDLVFPNKIGMPKDDKTDSRHWHKVLEECGIAKKRLHDARHTAATLLYDNGTDIEVIRRFLGNSSVDLTSRTYVHHSSRQLRGAADLILEITNGAKFGN